MKRGFFLGGYGRKIVQIASFGLLIFLVIAQTATAQAFSQNALNSIIGETPFFDPNAAPSCYSGNGNNSTPVSSNTTSSNPDVSFLAAWAEAESGGGGGQYNLLNSEYGPGTNYNSAGVKNYPTYQIGIEYTDKLLEQSNTAAILSALKNNNTQAAIAGVTAFYTWETTPTTANTISSILSSNSLNLNSSLPGLNGISLSKWANDVLNGLNYSVVPANQSGCSCSTGNLASINLSGNGNVQQAFNFFVSEGLTPTQSAAILGNFIQESGVNPEQIQHVPGLGLPNTSTNPNAAGPYGWGIAQWTPGSKVYSIMQSANISGPVYSLKTQLAMVWYQMTTQSPTGTNNVTALMKQQTNLANATTLFMTAFEAPNASLAAASARITDAQSVLATYGNTASSTSSGGAGATLTASDCSSGSGSTVSSSSSYQNPLRSVQMLSGERVDQGVDYKGQGPVYALGNGTIENLTNSGWDFGGYDGFIVEKLSDGPAAGLYAYVAEGCVPTSSLSIGETVTSNTVICNMINPLSTGIETGWATGPPIGASMAHQAGQWNPKLQYSTAYGANYEQLLASLGAPSVATTGPVQGSVPSNWPTW